MKREAIDRFIGNMAQLDKGVELNLYESSIDATFERICAALLKERDDEIWYDGTSDLVFENNKTLNFKGKMHVMEGQKKHWTETFMAEVSVTSTPSHCYVKIVCGEHEGAGNLYDLYGF